MKRTNAKRFGFGKTLLTGAAAVCAVALLFHGFTQAALASELGSRETVSTAYPEPVAISSQTSKPEAQGDYIKPSYSLIDNAMPYFQDKKPSATELTREEAAELGVRGLVEVFELNLNGKEIEMAFYPAENSQRSYWEGIWWPNGPKTGPDAYVAAYSFTVDAVSGELRGVGNSRVLDGRADAGFNASLNQESVEYEALAKEQAIKLGAIQGSVKNVAYAGQGSSNNDPDIYFNVTGENGDRAQLSFSRYDKTLLSVTFDRGMREMDVAVQQADDFAARAEEYFKNNPDATTYEE